MARGGTGNRDARQPSCAIPLPGVAENYIVNVVVSAEKNDFLAGLVKHHYVIDSRAWAGNWCALGPGRAIPLPGVADAVVRLQAVIATEKDYFPMRGIINHVV